MTAGVPVRKWSWCIVPPNDHPGSSHEPGQKMLTPQYSFNAVVSASKSKVANDCPGLVSRARAGMLNYRRKCREQQRNPLRESNGVSPPVIHAPPATTTERIPEQMAGSNDRKQERTSL